MSGPGHRRRSDDGQAMRFIGVIALVALAGCAVQDGRLIAAPPMGNMDEDKVAVAGLISASLMAIGLAVAIGREFR